MSRCKIKITSFLLSLYFIIFLVALFNIVVVCIFVSFFLYFRSIHAIISSQSTHAQHIPLFYIWRRTVTQLIIICNVLTKQNNIYIYMIIAMFSFILSHILPEFDLSFFHNDHVLIYEKLF
jgi:hypothetical protein